MGVSIIHFTWLGLLTLVLSCGQRHDPGNRKRRTNLNANRHFGRNATDLACCPTRSVQINANIESIQSRPLPPSRTGLLLSSQAQQHWQRPSANALAVSLTIQSQQFRLANVGETPQRLTQSKSNRRLYAWIKLDLQRQALCSVRDAGVSIDHCPPYNLRN